MSGWKYWSSAVWYVFVWIVAVLFFLSWPLFAWDQSKVNFTGRGWIAEHVWIGILGALLVVLGGLVLLFEKRGYVPVIGLRAASPPVFASMTAILAWPALTWAIGSVYTGYALTHGGWIAGTVWLGVLVIWLVVTFATA
jgi:hypothetical protein